MVATTRSTLYVAGNFDMDVMYGVVNDVWASDKRKQLSVDPRIHQRTKGQIQGFMVKMKNELQQKMENR